MGVNCFAVTFICLLVKSVVPLVGLLASSTKELFCFSNIEHVF